MGCISQELFKRLSGTLSKENTAAILRTLIKLYKYGGTTEEKLVQTLINDEHIKPKAAKIIVQTALMAGVEFGAIVKMPDIIYKLDDEFYSFLLDYYMREHSRELPFRKHYITKNCEASQTVKKSHSTNTNRRRKLHHIYGSSPKSPKSSLKSVKSVKSERKERNKIIESNSCISVPLPKKSPVRRRGRRQRKPTTKKYNKKVQKNSGSWFPSFFSRRNKGKRKKLGKDKTLSYKRRKKDKKNLMHKSRFGRMFRSKTGYKRKRRHHSRNCSCADRRRIPSNKTYLVRKNNKKCFDRRVNVQKCAGCKSLFDRKSIRKSSSSSLRHGACNPYENKLRKLRRNLDSAHKVFEHDKPKHKRKKIQNPFMNVATIGTQVTSSSTETQSCDCLDRIRKESRKKLERKNGVYIDRTEDRKDSNSARFPEIPVGTKEYKLRTRKRKSGGNDNPEIKTADKTVSDNKKRKLDYEERLTKKVITLRKIRSTSNLLRTANSKELFRKRKKSGERSVEIEKDTTTSATSIVLERKPTPYYPTKKKDSPDKNRKK